LECGWHKWLQQERIPPLAKGNTLTFIMALGLTLITSSAMAEEKPLCKFGTVANLVQSGTTWTWTCEGIHGGKSKSCSVKKIDGICGEPVYEVSAHGHGTNEITVPLSMLETDLCKSGTLAYLTGAVVDSKYTYTWTCKGKGIGTDASCSSDHKCYKVVTTCLGSPLGSPAGVSGCSGIANPYTQAINIGYEMAGGGASDWGGGGTSRILLNTTTVNSAAGGLWKWERSNSPNGGNGARHAGARITGFPEFLWTPGETLYAYVGGGGGRSGGAGAPGGTSCVGQSNHLASPPQTAACGNTSAMTGGYYFGGQNPAWVSGDLGANIQGAKGLIADPNFDRTKTYAVSGGGFGSARASSNGNDGVLTVMQCTGNPVAHLGANNWKTLKSLTPQESCVGSSPAQFVGQINMLGIGGMGNAGLIILRYVPPDGVCRL